MPKYRVYGKVVGGKYIGEFEADTPEEAEKMAWEDDRSCISFCHHCTDNCEDPEIDELTLIKSDE